MAKKYSARRQKVKTAWLKNALKSVGTTSLSTFKELEDSIYSMMSLYVSKEYLDLDLLEERKKEIEKVTKEDIIKFSKKIHMDTIYLLEGEA